VAVPSQAPEHWAPKSHVSGLLVSGLVLQVCHKNVSNGKELDSQERNVQSSSGAASHRKHMATIVALL
jgi:hypothetical protein